MFASKELFPHDFDKCVHDLTNKRIAKEKIRFRNYSYKF